MNSVLILFITQIDEFVLGVLMTINPTWVESMIPVKPKGQTFEECPLVEQPKSPNDEHDVMTVQHLQPALYELTENTNNDNSMKESRFDLAYKMFLLRLN